MKTIGKYKKNTKRNTRRVNKTTAYSHHKIVKIFLQMLNTVKLYHWKTTSYAQHKATDELYSNLNKNIDSFIEIMLGKTGNRINMSPCIKLPLSACSSSECFKREIVRYKNFLINMNTDAKLTAAYNSDLITIRDELLGNLNQFSYLMTFK